MELLGKSLDDLLVMCGGTLSTKTVCMLGEQMVSFISILD